MTDVFLCKTGALTAASRRELRKAGVVVVEVEDPTQCSFIRASDVLSGDDMLWAAMDALRRTFGYDKGKEQREQFALNIWDLVDAAREADGRPRPGRAKKSEGNP